MQQLELALAARRQDRHARPVVERLAAILRRRGIDTDWRKHPGDAKRGWILPLCGLDAGDRHRTEPRGPHSGLPAQGCWEILCAWHVNVAKQCPEDRYGYRDEGGAGAVNHTRRKEVS